MYDCFCKYMIMYDNGNLTMMAYLCISKFGNFEFLCEFQVLH